MSILRACSSESVVKNRALPRVFSRATSFESLIKMVPQQNLCKRFGSERSPRLSIKASFATRDIRNPYDFHVTSFRLLFMPFTAPAEIAHLDTNQLSNNGRWLRKLSASIFIGSKSVRLTVAIQRSRKLPAHLPLW